MRLTVVFLFTCYSLFLGAPLSDSNGKTAVAPAAGTHVYTSVYTTEKTVNHAVYAVIYSITIDKSDHKLYLYSNGIVRNHFPVGTGKRPSLTPNGIFKIINKAKYPTYFGIPGGSPNNPLGARWFGLNKVSKGGKRYGIHGTNNPRSIGKNSSAGCIRMHNKDVMYLYQLVPVGTVVTIRD